MAEQPEKKIRIIRNEEEVMFPSSITESVFKNPDELLQKALATLKNGKKSLDSPATEPPFEPLAPIKETPPMVQEPAFINPKLPLEQREKVIKAELERKRFENTQTKKMQDKYERELAQWKEYAENVRAWQSQVLDIVAKLREQAQKTSAAQSEVQELKRCLKIRDDELSTFHHHNKRSMLDWMKGFVKTPRPQTL